ncbi:PEP-CTERM sorting domain-containing protein [Pontiella sulfatireligans]|uniref:PEP-CTERM protein-sorting domain-containing protein n=1 Tax=Pontiella sulfatireligans TaxID=2750658 RepID=A0A6C2URB2_9BACT|nr:PEP-CTERM sorting domain-containing protein [Pontiella sulfatireligans]VGO21777.1 hypothetical protein SCARR_03854 [Pontiella sulfatireligans]
MKRKSRKGLKTNYYSIATLTLLLAGFAPQASAEPVPPWEEKIIPATPPPYMMFWGYNFDDGELNSPTLTTPNGGNWHPANPKFSFSSGITSSNGTLGIYNATEETQASIRIDLDNDYDVNNIKYVWFEYDFVGPANSIANTGGTDDTSHSYQVGEITYTIQTANHVQGYYTIEPQPEDEWLQFDLTAAIGETVTIDNLQVGSTCIPEPASFSLIAISGLGSWFVRRRRLRGVRRKSQSNFINIPRPRSFLSEEIDAAPIGGSHEILAYHIK